MQSLNNPYYIRRGRYVERRVTLFREVNMRVRYYSLRLSMSLFGEYMIVRENGSIKNKRATRVVTKYFNTLREAMDIFEITLEQKRKKGYALELKP